MASPSQEALTAAAATAQGLVPPDAAAFVGAQAATAAQLTVAQQVLEPVPLLQQPVGGMVAGDGRDAAGEAVAGNAVAAGGQQPPLCHTSSGGSLSCSEQLSQGGAEDEVGQEAESTGEQPLPLPVPALPSASPPPLQGEAQRAEQPAVTQQPVELPGKRKLTAQPCGTAIEATAPTWVTFNLPAAALGSPAGGVIPVRCRFLFQKPLSASDAGRLGRMVMPRCAEHYLPQPDGPEGLWLDVMDPEGRRYQWLLKFWLSHTQTASGGPAKRTYVFENCRPWQLAWQVAARTTLAFYQLPSGGYLVDPHAVESHFSEA
ncbi:B3 domain-containing-like isoform X1 [Chlorella sorokiniana]|uniref:B3 domain-containing-like isoform X1 n=1 Tax=Chlorella sorokiniana TaxID=3076 RepID=A0A2P6U5M0_CHLSO|nr:B3 domain-containing-like isoform X1 [Chlorella sorokiniana]|eukprot:PRW61616.1 B3 domain-containing-like isoform X1 [Chlorella sorokiniana]